MKQRKRSKRRTIHDEIAEHEKLDPHQKVPVRFQMVRSLYLHALRAVRDDDFASLSGYFETLTRRDKHFLWVGPREAMRRDDNGPAT